jgi:hypothetical protein
MTRRTLIGVAGTLLAAALAAGAPAATAPPDRVPPTKPTIDGQVRPEALRPVFTFGATDRRTGRGRMRFRCAFDGAALRPCARAHRPAAALGFGAHTLRVRALDLAGNLSRVSTFSFTVVGTWDAARDFERAPRPANPGRDRYGNTAWFYAYSTQGRGHDPATYAALPTFSVLAPNWEVWLLAPNSQSASTGFSNGHMILHPGPSDSGQNAILGWRSPVATEVRLDLSIDVGPAQSVCPVTGNGITWSLDQGARSLRSGTLLSGRIEGLEVTANIGVGESLYVVVGDNGDSNCDSTDVRLSIETR